MQGEDSSQGKFPEAGAGRKESGMRQGARKWEEQERGLETAESCARVFGMAGGRGGDTQVLATIVCTSFVESELKNCDEPASFWLSVSSQNLTSVCI